MKLPALHIQEEERIEALESLRLLDTEPEVHFDEITFLASEFFKTPVALISLVDTDRQWFKSRVGVEVCQTDRSISFCGHVINQDDVFVVENALDDIRFFDNPLVTDGPKIRFYAGAKILSPGKKLPIGTLCIISPEPRQFTSLDREILQKLANQVGNLLELRLDNQRIKETYAQLSQQAEDLQKAQQRLMSEQKNLSQVLNALDKMAIVSISNTKGTIIHANDNFCKISGYTQAELLGQDHRIINSGYHDKRFFRDMWNDINSGKNWSGEIKNRKKDGSYYHVFTLIAPMFDETGSLSCYFSVRFDITKQKELEEELLEAQKITQLGSWKFDLKNKQHIWSPELFNICECDDSIPPAKLLKYYRSLIHKEDIDDFNNLLSRLNEGEQQFISKHRLVVGEKIKHIQCIGKITFDGNGEPLYFSGTSRDCTGEYEAEKKLELEKAKTLQSSKLASIGEMSASIAHEVNNPLTIITSSLSVIKRHNYDKEMLERRVEMMVKASDRIAKIVSGLRKFARTKNSNDHLFFKISELIEESMVFINIKSHNFNVPVRLEIENDFSFICNNVEIEQVIINLVNNGIDEVRTREDRWVKIHIRSEGDTGILRVIDSGHGISREIEAKIFDPFYTTKPAGEGTGLGLPIVKGIVESHGATIHIDHDSPNTCFEVRFKNCSSDLD